MKTWDVFISHASEDKVSVAQPLADVLLRAGLAVWLDSCELRLGDSLRVSIDQGLAESSFGVVILSQAFFAKQWTVRELNGLFAMDDDDRRILPVWHGVERDDVRRFSPILADRKATSTKFGIDYVAREIAEVVRRGDDAIARGGLTAQINALIEQGPDPPRLSFVLQIYPQVVAELLGVGIGNLSVAGGRNIAGHHVDLEASIHRPSGWEGYDCHYFLFGPAATDERDGAIDPRVVTAVETLRSVQTALESLDASDSSRDDSHTGIVLASRRSLIGRAQKELRRDLGESRLAVRTYDWLLEACVKVDTVARRLGPRWGR